MASMRPTEVKALWGRAASRCSICKIELATDTTEGLTGEMAHIVAKSPDGPRGDRSLTPEEREDYSNKILLCPNHHTMIDKDISEWTVNKILKIKKEHEQWVADKLSQGSISESTVDNSKFLESRKEEWVRLTSSRFWSIVSITPLRISDDRINPLDKKFLEALAKFEYWNIRYESPININRLQTNPNHNGIINEDKRDESKYRIEVFRKGHCEFLLCLNNLIFEQNRLEYTHIANCIQHQVKSLKFLWESTLPFNDMLISVIITSTKNKCLHSGNKTFFSAEYGDRVEASSIEHSFVASKDTDWKEILDSLLTRIVNSFGLDIDSVFDEQGNLNLPHRLRL
jgi:hypothetical protein